MLQIRLILGVSQNHQTTRVAQQDKYLADNSLYITKHAIFWQPILFILYIKFPKNIGVDICVRILQNKADMLNQINIQILTYIKQIQTIHCILMISEGQIKNNMGGASDFQLGINSVAANLLKQCATTDCCTSDSPDYNFSDRYTGENSQEAIEQMNYTIQELKLRLIKLGSLKTNMDLRFKKQITLLNNQLSYLNQENRELKEMTKVMRKNISEIKTDLPVIKECIQKRQLKFSLSPQLAKFQKQGHKGDRQSPKNRASKLFKSKQLKIQ